MSVCVCVCGCFQYTTGGISVNSAVNYGEISVSKQLGTRHSAVLSVNYGNSVNYRVHNGGVSSKLWDVSKLQ